MKKALLAAFFLCVVVISTVARAQDSASVPQAVAPEEQLPSWLQYKPPYLGEENDITNPHRTADEMTMWAQRAAADVLTFDKDNYADKMKDFQKYFVPQGWQQYTDYLKSEKVIDMVSSGEYSIGGIVDEVPQIINQGATGGAYHWILRMPVTISFFKKDPVSGEMKTGPSGKFYLFLDVLRVAHGGGDDGIAITNWRVMDAPSN